MSVDSLLLDRVKLCLTEGDLVKGVEVLSLLHQANPTNIGLEDLRQVKALCSMLLVDGGVMEKLGLPSNRLSAKKKSSLTLEEQLLLVQGLWDIANATTPSLVTMVLGDFLVYLYAGMLELVVVVVVDAEVEKCEVMDCMNKQTQFQLLMQLQRWGWKRAGEWSSRLLLMSGGIRAFLAQIHAVSSEEQIEPNIKKLLLNTPSFVKKEVYFAHLFNELLDISDEALIKFAALPLMQEAMGFVQMRQISWAYFINPFLSTNALIEQQVVEKMVSRLKLWLTCTASSPLLWKHWVYWPAIWALYQYSQETKALLRKDLGVLIKSFLERHSLEEILSPFDQPLFINLARGDQGGVEIHPCSSGEFEFEIAVLFDHWNFDEDGFIKVLKEYFTVHGHLSKRKLALARLLMEFISRSDPSSGTTGVMIKGQAGLIEALTVLIPPILNSLISSPVGANQAPEEEEEGREDEANESEQDLEVLSQTLELIQPTEMSEKSRKLLESLYQAHFKQHQVGGLESVNRIKLQLEYLLSKVDDEEGDDDWELEVEGEEICIKLMETPEVYIKAQGLVKLRSLIPRLKDKEKAFAIVMQMLKVEKDSFVYLNAVKTLEEFLRVYEDKLRAVLEAYSQPENVLEWRLLMGQALEGLAQRSSSLKTSEIMMPFLLELASLAVDKDDEGGEEMVKSAIGILSRICQNHSICLMPHMLRISSILMHHLKMARLKRPVVVFLAIFIRMLGEGNWELLPKGFIREVQPMLLYLATQDQDYIVRVNAMTTLEWMHQLARDTFGIRVESPLMLLP